MIAIDLVESQRMKIDRERFLLTVTALATGAIALTPGCSDARPAKSPDPDHATISAQPARVLVAASVKKSPNPYDGDPVTAKVCDPKQNKEGSPSTSSCSTLKAPGPTCESFRDTKQECPTLTQLLKPKVATAALECLKRKSGTQEICEFNITSICAYEALGEACLEPYAKTACDDVIKKCGPPHGHYNKMTRESCEAGVSGIADNKRKKFISCISESCRFETCLTYL